MCSRRILKDAININMVQGSRSSALSVLVCLACIACGAVDAFVGPMSAARGSLTRVTNDKQIAPGAYSRAPRGCFTGTSAMALENSRARLLRTAAGSNEMSMMAGAAKKTAIITGASSGKLAPQQIRHLTTKGYVVGYFDVCTPVTICRLSPTVSKESSGW